MPDISECRTTDLLIGIVSINPENNLHFFIADFDKIDENELMNRVGRILFDQEKFGDIYMIKTGNGFHLINFTEQLTLEKYVELLEKMEADHNFVDWIKRVKYGVLRLSRRSSHFKVPKLYRVLISPYRKSENILYKNIYFKILGLEEFIDEVKRVKVIK